MNDQVKWTALNDGQCMAVYNKMLTVAVDMELLRGT